MKKEIADQWVAALRDPKYTQTRGALRVERSDGDNTNHKFCCLGVLCDISNVGRWDKRHDHDRYACDRDTSSARLPREVQAWAGMNTFSGELRNGGDSLIVLNDQGSSFEEIAQIIEQNWETL